MHCSRAVGWIPPALRPCITLTQTGGHSGIIWPLVDILEEDMRLQLADKPYSFPTNA